MDNSPGERNSEKTIFGGGHEKNSVDRVKESTGRNNHKKHFIDGVGDCPSEDGHNGQSFDDSFDSYVCFFNVLT